MVSPKFTTLPDVVHEVQGHLDLGNCYVPAPPGLGSGHPPSATRPFTAPSERHVAVSREVVRPCEPPESRPFVTRRLNGRRSACQMEATNMVQSKVEGDQSASEAATTNVTAADQPSWRHWHPQHRQVDTR
ncbi:hypothetical protein JCM18899A_22200 [Nocardioides sp. AN3]